MGKSLYICLFVLALNSIGCDHFSNKTTLSSISTDDSTNDSPTLTFHSIFVTSGSWNANLGGLAGADAKCQSAATAAGLGGTWKAILSSTTVDAKDHISITMPVYNLRPAGSGGTQKIVDDEAAFWNSNSVDWSAGIQYQENGISSTNDVWTGTEDNGVQNMSTCSDWTDGATSGPTILAGEADETDGNQFIENDTTDCSDTNSLYCINGQ